MSQTTENLLPAVSGQDLGNSPSQEWDVFARDVSISGPINLVPSGEGQAGQVLTSGGAGNPAGWSSGGVNVVGGTGISVSTVGDTVTVTNTATATPASPDTSVQFNDGGAFGGSALAKINKLGGRTLEISTVASSPTSNADAVYATATDNGANASHIFGVNASAYSLTPVASGGIGQVAGVSGFAQEQSPDTATTAVVAGFIASGNSAGAAHVTDYALFYGDTLDVNGTAVITNGYGLRIPTFNVGTHNYGIKIGDIGTSSANDWAIRTGWGKSVFGGDADDPITIWASDTEWGSNSTLHIPVGDTFILGTKSNNHTDSHVLMSASINTPAVTLSSTSGTGAIPTIDLYGNTNHTYIDSGIYTIVNNSGVASSITTNNTGGDFPATGNSTGLTIVSTGSGAGTYFGSGLEVTGIGSDYEHSFGIQVQSASRAIFTGGAQINTTTTRPTASAAIRGTLWVAQGAAGVADKIQVVLKDAANAYAWHDITFV